MEIMPSSIVRTTRSAGSLTHLLTVALLAILPVRMPAHAEVVQALPSQEALNLNAALNRLARNPRDVDALADAGDAAQAMSDFEAAIGFYKRAEEISPGNQRVMAGHATALVYSDEPVSAIALFERAERAGADAVKLAADRGLAYDLVGDTSRALQYYRLVIGGAPDNDEVRRRLALSLAISGDERGAEAALLPLLRKQDKAAWRARAFALAIVNKTDEAVKVAQAILPGQLAEGISPYLRYMPRLTRAQQAAAANLGRFPRASEIGRDDPRIAEYARNHITGNRLAAVDQGLVPKGKPLGSGGVLASSPGESARASRSEERNRRREERRSQRQAERTAPPEPKPARNGRAVAQISEPVATAASAPAAEPPMPAAATQEIVVPPNGPASASAPAVSQGFDLAKVKGSSAGQTAPASGKSEQPASFSDMFDDLGKPQTSKTPAAGAVDLRNIEPAKPKPKVEPKPELPRHPSRIWIQLGIGQDKSAISFDWTKLNRSHADLFRGRKLYISDMGRTNRMLTGPFGSRKEADEFLAELRKAGLDGPYVWTSPAGQVVDAL